jgi:predicted DNA-binding transcriptional regulator AlpA
MARQTILPPTLPPRLISRQAAAAYVSLSPNTFDELVKVGRMPAPKRLTDRRIAWDVRELDSFVDGLASTDTDKDSDEGWEHGDAS